MAIFAEDTLLRLQLQYTISGNRLSCNMHYALDTPVVAGTAFWLGSAWETDIFPQWRAVQSNEVKYESLYITAVKPNVSNPEVRYFVNKVGALAAESIPSNLAAVIQLRQNDELARYNGRVFISGIPENEIESGLIRGSFIFGPLGTLATNMQTPITAGGNTFTLVAVSRFHGGVPITPEGYTVVQVNPTRALGTQRRRTTELRQFHA